MIELDVQLSRVQVQQTKNTVNTSRVVLIAISHTHVRELSNEAVKVTTYR